MTRLLIGLSFLLSLLEAAPLLAQGQAASGGGLRAAPPQQAARQPAGPQAVLGPPNESAIGPITAIPQGPPPGPQQPGWIPLPQAHEEWVNQTLQYWEARSNKIKTFSCQFTRWEYDPVFGPQGPDDAKTIAKGEIKYAQPDKGLFQVTELHLYSPPAKEGDKPQYVKQDAVYGEHWVSNGERVFEFDARGKRLIERELPPEMKNKAIADGPLPFLFGARAETIKARYWVRGLPQGGNGKYWLEAVPKSRQDAQNFKAVTIVLDEKTFLPELLEVLAPNFDARTNPARTTYQFSKHEVTEANAVGLPNVLKLFAGNFANPRLPSGWTRIVERADGTTRAPGALEATKLQPPRGIPR